MQRLSSEIVRTGVEAEVGDLVAVAGRLDGYVAASRYAGLMERYRLEDDWDGAITLRTTSFDIAEVRRISNEGRVLAAVDLAGSLDARERSAGVTILDEALEKLRA